MRYSMLGLCRLHIHRLRRGRTSPAHLHGRPQDARQAQERHQLPSCPLPEENPRTDEEGEACQEVRLSGPLYREQEIWHDCCTATSLLRHVIRYSVIDRVEERISPLVDIWCMVHMQGGPRLASRGG